MNPALLVYDDFLADPYSWRDWAMRQDFNVDPVFEGRAYHGCIPISGPGMLADLETQLTKAVGPCKVSLAFARMALKDEETPAWIHPDTAVGEGSDAMAGVLYLTRPRFCMGGTAFWAHNELGWDAVPTLPEMQAQGARWETVADLLTKDANDQSKWSMTGLVPMKYNRFLTYPVRTFHSRWPKLGWGTNYDNGRLIIACFYSKEAQYAS